MYVVYVVMHVMCVCRLCMYVCCVSVRYERYVVYACMCECYV